ncbi:MAG: hypothetical protein AB1758_05470 [Candidatus Eremiobacterota bacterium]
MSRELSTERAFSIPEVVLCLGLVSLSLLALIGSMIYGLRANQDAGGSHLAGVAASSLLNQARQSLRKDFSRSVASPRRPLPAYPGLEYQLVERTEPGGRLKRLEVTVYWKDRQGPRELRVWTRVLP